MIGASAREMCPSFLTRCLSLRGLSRSGVTVPGLVFPPSLPSCLPFPFPFLAANSFLLPWWISGRAFCGVLSHLLSPFRGQIYSEVCLCTFALLPLRSFHSVPCMSMAGLQAWPLESCSPPPPAPPPSLCPKPPFLKRRKGALGCWFCPLPCRHPPRKDARPESEQRPSHQAGGWYIIYISIGTNTRLPGAGFGQTRPWAFCVTRETSQQALDTEPAKHLQSFKKA